MTTVRPTNVAAVHVIQGEVQNVLAAMRMNRRWAGGGTLGPGSPNDSPLLKGLRALTATLHEAKDLSPHGMLEYLSPFLEVIRSEETSGPVTGVALVSLSRFLASSIFREDAPGAGMAMNAIADAASHCRFETTDPDSDEVVLMRILQVLQASVMSPLGALLSEDKMYELVQTCFRMTVQPRLSELLRRTAEAALADIVRGMARNILAAPHRTNTNNNNNNGAGQPQHTEHPQYDTHIDDATDTDTNKVNNTTQQTQNTGGSTPRTPVDSPRDPEGGPMVVAADGSLIPPSPSAPLSSPPTQEAHVSPRTPFVNPRGVRFEVHEPPIVPAVPHQDEADPDTTLPAPPSPTQPYGLSCFTRVFSFFISLLDSHTLENHPYPPEDTRLLSLHILSEVIDMVGSRVSDFPSLLSLVQTDLCKHLLITLARTRSLTLFTMCLRLMHSLFVCAREHLKCQLEAYFTVLLTKLMDNKATPYEHQEHAMESIVHLCRVPSLMVDVYANYDCDVYCTNLFENLCKFLYKNAFPVNGAVCTVHMLALDGLLAVARSIADRMATPAPSGDNALTPTQTRRLAGSQKERMLFSAEVLRKRKQVKSSLITAAEHFNKSPKEAMVFLQNNQLLPSPPDPRSVTLFLRNTTRLDKAQVGEYLGKRDDAHKNVLVEYCKTFDLVHSKFIDCLRGFLESFRIPGEAQVIDRIVDNFSEVYFNAVAGSKNSNSDVFASKDAVHLLSFSVIMLNVDMHNPQVKKKMTLDQYLSQLRKTNGDKDFPREMLIDIHNNIKHNEIRIPEEFPSGEVSDATWRDLLLRAKRVAPFVCTTSGEYDKDIFGVIWGPIVAAISIVFETAPPYSTPPPIDPSPTATYPSALPVPVPRDYDETHMTLRKTLDGFDLCGRIAYHYRLSDVMDNLVINLCKFSNLSPSQFDNAAHFGCDDKALMATVGVFQSLRQYKDFVREGWRNVLHCIVSLHNMSLLPVAKLIDSTPNFDAGEPQAPTKQAVQKKRDMSSSSLLSPFGLGWFGGGSSGEVVSSGVSEEEKEAERRAIACVDMCGVKDVLGLAPPKPGLQGIASSESLMYLVRALIVSSTKPKKSTPSVERVGVFCLDILSGVTLCNMDQISTLWPVVNEHLQGIVMSATAPSPLVDRAVVQMMHLALNMLGHNEACTTYAIQTVDYVARVPQGLFTSPLCGQALTAITKLLEKGPSVGIPTGVVWDACRPLLIAVASAGHVSVLPRAFAVVHQMVSGKDGEAFVTASNFGGVVDTLLFFTKLRGSPNIIAIQAMEQMLILYSRVLALLDLTEEDIVTESPLLSAEKTSTETDKLKSLRERAAKRKREDRKKEAWDKFWRPVLVGFCGLCRDHRVDVRNYAMTYLQRALVSPLLSMLSPQGWFVCFEEVIFPLLTDLLRPADDRSEPGTEPIDPAGLEETRLRASGLLSKIFLQHLPTILKYEDFHILWLKILQFIEAYMVSDHSELLAESVPESLKNILLVMSASGVFQPGKLTHGHDIWQLSWDAIEAFCPSLREDANLNLMLSQGQVPPRPTSPFPSTPASTSTLNALPEVASTPLDVLVTLPVVHSPPIMSGSPPSPGMPYMPHESPLRPISPSLPISRDYKPHALFPSSLGEAMAPSSASLLPHGPAQPSLPTPPPQTGRVSPEPSTPSLTQFLMM
eukprot:TRINITY_DN3078_c0_g1_i3.p1 TRINITY_DN3078_c0_g1~~TRINITY_DN3078_c0_g1_i3.p1  ORF type:complete len:1663 (+),score=447.69 TRINITY_DN3078_c0_g1_i3:135-5123(+)